MNMKTLRPLLISVAVLASMLGCKKEEGTGVPVSPTPDPIRAVIDDARAAATQTFTMDGSSGGSIIGANGTVITAMPNAFRDHDGNPVTGTITIELLEAFSVADMVRSNLRTVASYGGDKRMLQSGGEVRLRAEVGGVQVTVDAGAVRVYFPCAVPDYGMRYFEGVEDVDGDVLWVDADELDVDTAIFLPDSAGGGGWLSGSYYNEPWPANSFGDPTWPPFAFMNCDHPLPPGGDSTDVTINLPSDASDDAVMVWIVLPEINCMVFMELREGNSVRAGFPVRVGLEGTIVALTGSDGSYRSTFTPITVTVDHEQSITLEPTTLAQYELDLQGL